ncbi:amino acid ABC transporter permease [Devosia sp. J2-20]|jgi:general L-amino acid transport system permease protein|uniref:Amino acid ABC transporter permease n=1 Tax=Devosia litorisediminis TaxID=2829817 RepID=A0A942E660_9HYPH|nr:MULTISPECIES: amino acid ABC transporter permease [Devosia]MBS3848735.1 amino acid ABC transporter permease [Devosia litorisediminis]MCZ4346281.1 amino acid ABC transporter permease [Devosia neptuniae]WDQ98221.1 amino acid ABC transporter permease [Devosia sp. J2-20]|tara:strand:- start:19414 stop:20541 length:1128 start_codon:yes stop_codon:yes gene_type:complete
MTTSTSYVRDEFSPERPAPGQTGGLILWLRTNLFATPSDALLTILGMVFLFWAVPPLYNFIIGHAVMPGGTVEDCRVEGAGACWAYIYARFNFFIYGFYPIDQYWRPNIVFVMLAALIIPLAIPAAPFKRLNAALFFVVFPVVTFYLLNGGVFGLREVPTEQWGGLMVTLIISLVGIICSIPIGILLALGRQSDLPIIKTLSVMFIELWRAVPLITVLFMASIMLPLFMPTGTTVDKLLRALVGVTLFSSAYMAEVVRGGLQALPRGQYEAGASLGLSYWKRTYFIILPQALKHVIPGIVNNFIALFKDTSLVSIVGIFDLLNTVQSASSDIDWASPTQAVTGYVFAAFMFWIFCFAMSRYSLWMEHRLNTGHKR